MNQDTLLSWYNRFEKVIGKLPGPIQKAILSEIQPVKQLFLEQRLPRILLLGTSTVSRVEVINSFFSEQIIPLTGENPPAMVPGWETFRRVGRGAVQILDGRHMQPLQWQAGRQIVAPDVILFLYNSGEIDAALGEAVERLGQVLADLELKFQTHPAVFGVLEGVGPQPFRQEAEFQLEGALRSNAEVNKCFAAVVPILRWSRFRADGSSGEESAGEAALSHLMSVLIDELPVAAKLEMARVARIKAAQRKIADSLIKATTAVSAAIGAQPIPLADLPVLTALQSSMVAGIIYISGGELNVRSALKFCGALGVNIGVAILLRESARAAAKFVPGFGYAISGGFAAAGTMAIGRSASGFFIEGISMKDARNLFRSKKNATVKKPPALPKNGMEE